MADYDPIPMLENAGYTEQEAAFLYLVAVHSGYFLRRQFSRFVQRDHGGLVDKFIQKTLRLDHLQVIECGQARHVYHLTSRPMWHQLIDHPESYPESSSTGMFTFAMITGVKNGWLDEKAYGNAARKGWLGLVSYLEPNGDVRNVCQGTNKKNDLQYYLDRERLTGDLHGQAPILWSASALLR